MKRTALVVIGLALAAALAPHTRAYNFDGPRWPTTQVPFFVNPVNNDVSQDAAITALQVAAATWGEQTNANIELYYAGRTTGASLANNGVNEVFFRNQTDEGASAAAYYWYNGSGELIDADIVIWDAAYTFFTGQSGCSGNGIYIEDVASHEFGHVLGLNHSSDSTATMYPSMPAFCDQTWRVLSPDDKAGIEALYPAAAPAPASPANLAAAVVTARVNLSWVDQAQNETGIVVERSVNGGGFSALVQLPANSTSYSDAAVQGSTTYSYRARSWNAGGSSPYSNVASVTSAPVQLPSAPVVVSPGIGATGIGTSVTLSWLPAGGATSYDVFFGTTSNPPAFRTNLSGTSVSANKLVAGVTYFWRVVSKNSAGQVSGQVWRFTTAPKAAKPGNRR
jgi:hypothetical protein